MVHSENLEHAFGLDFLEFVDHANVHQIEVDHEVFVAHKEGLV